MESTKKDKASVLHLFKKQEDIHKWTSKVQVFLAVALTLAGSSFFFKNSAFFEVGSLRLNQFEEVAIEEKKQINGIVAKLCLAYQSGFTDFEF